VAEFLTATICTLALVALLLAPVLLLALLVWAISSPSSSTEH
jgi:hypothetical protein